MTFILVDTANTFFRARHVIRGDASEKVGMAFHIIFNSIKKAWKDFDGSHVVFALEGRSWRKDHYAPYKRNRTEARAALSPREQEEDKLFWETFDQFKEFITTKTNCSVLHHPTLEADDLIAGFIRLHPNHNHVIISTDSDFSQLINHNVCQYNGVSGVTTKSTGYYDEKGKPVVDKKTKTVKPAPDPEWLLFEKCMRGDTTDNIFSAYPGVREKGTKNKIGLREAFSDRNNKGYNWNNMMLQRWLDHEGIEHRVKEDYERNRILCDLNAQPHEVKEIIDQVIIQEVNSNKNISQVGTRLLKLCREFDLQRISDSIEQYARPLNSRYADVNYSQNSSTKQVLVD